MFSARAGLVLALALCGCGSSEKGAAKPEDTPVVNQEEVREKIMQGMPPEMKAKYGSRMKSGGN
jgi:hypothetical protein